MAALKQDRLAPEIRNLPVFQAFYMVRDRHGFLLRSAPFLNEPGVSQRLHELERQPTFVAWGVNPWTGKKVSLELSQWAPTR